LSNYFAWGSTKVLEALWIVEPLETSDFYLDKYIAVRYICLKKKHRTAI